MTWLLELLKKEMFEIKNDMRRPSFLFGAALAYLIVFGMLYLPNIVTAVPAVIYDEENSAASRRLIQSFEASDSYDIKGYVTSEEEMRAWLQEKQAIAAIEIPKDFSKKAKTGSCSTVLYLINGSNIILTNITSSAAQDIVADASDHLAAKQAALPSFIFSGCTWPTESMGQGMQLASQFFPLSHFSNTVRELFLIGSSPYYWESIEKLTALAVGFFLAGFALYHRRLRLSRRAAAG